MSAPSRSARQRGITLMVSLIMLILITLLAVSAFRMSFSHTTIVANQQLQGEAVNASAFALDTVTNDPDFATTAAHSLEVNTGIAAYAVAVGTPTCIRVRTLSKAELVTMTNGVPSVSDEDMRCIKGSNSSPLTIVDEDNPVSSSGDSVCATALWAVNATAAPTDLQSGVSATLVAGIAERITVSEAQTYCQ